MPAGLQKQLRLSNDQPVYIPADCFLPCILLFPFSNKNEAIGVGFSIGLKFIAKKIRKCSDLMGNLMWDKFLDLTMQ